MTAVAATTASTMKPTATANKEETVAKTKTENDPILSFASAPDNMNGMGYRGIPSTILNTEAMIGQYVVVHSAPTAWIGCLVAVEHRGEAMGVTLADAGLWINGELKEVIRPGLKAGKDTDSSHHHLTYVQIVTALQPAGSPSTIASWKQKYRGKRPGDPNVITLEHYSKFCGMDEDTCAKAITNAFTAGAKTFDSLITTMGNYSDHVGFPSPAVASILLSDVLSRTW